MRYRKDFWDEISFSIYLIDDPCRPLALEKLQSIDPAPLAAIPVVGFAFVASSLVVPLAWAAYLTVARPGQRLVRGLALVLDEPAI
ncbi:MAG: hypothetical protein M3Y22_04315 [Pseudomonadota bacterium]|nr:hypothetical protein [Pseudomonadota bacterium]